jgi:hypothetical protein
MPADFSWVFPGHIKSNPPREMQAVWKDVRAEWKLGDTRSTIFVTLLFRASYRAA